MDVVKACLGLGLGIFLTGCAATYDSAEQLYQKGEINEARKDWESLAKKGDVRSMYRLYTSARQSSDSDIEWLKNAADLNLSEAQYDYGMWLYSKEKYEESQSYLSKASDNSSEKAKSILTSNLKTFPLLINAEKGDEKAPAKLGEYYWEKKEYLNAIKWYERCVDTDTYCSFYLGLANDNGYGITQDYKKAIEWYLHSAEKGNVHSARNLAWLYEYGKGTEVNKSDAFKWMSFANKYGYETTSISLGRYYLYGIGTEKNESKALELLSKYSNQNVTAAYHLARMYYLGLGVDKDYKKSYQLFSSKVLADNAASIYYLAEHYYRGYGLPKDLNRALELYTKAAEKGDADAEFRLGWMYAKGEGIAENQRKAFYWYTQAAEKGNASAQNNLGVMYDSGTATEKNKYTAFKWFKKSAEQGSATAQDNLAGMYEDGSGTRKDFQKAVYWYAKAAQQNHQEAQSGLNNILSRITKKYINVSESSLYAKQDFDSQIVKKVGRGDTVYIISNSRGWSQVYFPENNSLGYVHNSHLR